MRAIVLSNTASHGIEVNREQIDGYVKNSLMLVTALKPTHRLRQRRQGGEQRAPRTSSLREAAIELGSSAARNLTSCAPKT